MKAIKYILAVTIVAVLVYLALPERRAYYGAYIQDIIKEEK